MDYIGSKEKMNEWIFDKMMEHITPAQETFLDACTGSASVSKYAAKMGFGKIISNDIMEFPAHIVRGAMCLPQSKLAEATSIINDLNNLAGVNGFFFNNYSASANRLFFTDPNAKKIDACRQHIENNITDTYMKSYLLYCLLEALSSVSNCTGVHAAFLKQFKERALKPIIIKPQPSMHLTGVIETFNEDILSLLKNTNRGFTETLLYIDPPYNHRQYGPNYHLYETLVKYDDPIISGKTGLREWQKESKSAFCSKKECAIFIKKVVEATLAKQVFISYNSDGLLTKDEMMDTFSSHNIKCFSISQKRYKSDSSKEREYNQSKLFEYLFKITK